MECSKYCHFLAAFALLGELSCAPGSVPSAPLSGQGAAAELAEDSNAEPGERGQENSGTLQAAPPGAGADEPRRDGAAPGEESALPPGTKILHVGDSFAGALGIPLGELFEASGMRSVLKHTDSSYLTDWAWDGQLQKYLWKYNPDLVIVTLGANELEIVNPQLREKTVRKIVETIGERPCVWVAIPLWDGPKNGLLDVIRKNSAPCTYMDTNAQLDTTQMARISDGIHPTTEARKVWAAHVLAWLRAHRSPTPERPWNIE